MKDTCRRRLCAVSNVEVRSKGTARVRARNGSRVCVDHVGEGVSVGLEHQRQLERTRSHCFTEKNSLQNSEVKTTDEKNFESVMQVLHEKNVWCMLRKSGLF